MTQPRESHPEAGMRRMLAQAVRATLAAGADDEAFAMGRAAAQIVGLRGLDACIAALEARPALVARASGLVERLEQLAASESLADIRAADPELLARAEALVAGKDAPEEPPADAGDANDPEAEPPADTLSVAEALQDMPLTGKGAAELAARVRLATPVAAALRAALEWLNREAERPRPLRLRAEDSVLEVLCEGVLPNGLAAVHEVLAAADGSLAPLGDIGLRAGAAGTWVVRVPAWSPRPLHLMIEQGPLRLAVPWHAVLRVSLVPSIEIEMRGGSLATPVLAPLAPYEVGVGERPVLALAHGLKRALLVADRLVWRLGAEACEPAEPAPVPALRRTVRSDEGGVFWVVEAGPLLSALPLSVIPPAPRTTPAAPIPSSPASAPEPQVLGLDDVEPLVLAAVDVEPIAARVEAPVGAPRDAFAEPAAEPSERILPEWLDRFGATGAHRHADPAPPAILPPPVATVEPITVPAAQPAGARSALIAEDSIAARHFLARLFEQRGLFTHAVASRQALREALARQAWDVVCVDVDLPDGYGRALLDEVRAALEPRNIPCVALVRDDQDAELAEACGVRRWLRKPFDRDEVGHLLARLGLVQAENA